MTLLRGLNMNSTDEFLKALQSLQPLPELVLEYRIHYNDQGTIVMCSMTNHPENTQYLVVDKKIYDNYFRYRVEDGKLKMVDNDPGYRVQLKSSTQGYAVVKNHAGILLELNEEYRDIEYYDANC